MITGTQLPPQITSMRPFQEHPSTPPQENLTLNSSSKPNFVALLSRGKQCITSMVANLIHFLYSVGGNQGEVESPLAGEIRLQSDHTVCSFR